MLTINVPLILKVRKNFFFAGKTYNGAFRGVFPGGRDLFDPLIVLSVERERKREREREREREWERERERERGQKRRQLYF
jgi:hypothetical protein